MSARDETWICPQHPFGHTWTPDIFRCSLCGERRIASEAVVSLIGGLRGWDTDRAAVVRDAFRAEVLREAADVAAPGPSSCDCGGCAECASQHIAYELHRMADEAAPTTRHATKDHA